MATYKRSAPKKPAHQKKPVTFNPPVERPWSDQQRAIIAWLENGSSPSLRVIARAGCGKSTTIAGCLRSVEPTRSDVYVLVFNTHGKKDLQQKVPNPEWVRTFNSIGHAAICMHMKKSVIFDENKDYQCAKDAVIEVFPEVTEEKDQNRIIAGVLAGASITKQYASSPAKDWNRPVADNVVVFACSRHDAFGDLEEHYPLTRLLDAVQKALSLSLNNMGRVSFTDQLFLPVVGGLFMVQKNLVMVDESQDLNQAQIAILRKVLRKGGRIVIVGDNRQAIYGWRGAAPDAMDRLSDTFKTEDLSLSVTYRCGKAIVDMVLDIVPDYQAGPNNPEGVIHELGPEGIVTEAKAGDFILSRVNAPLLKLCLSLLKAGKPSKVLGRDIGKELVNMVKRFEVSTIPALCAAVREWEEKETARLTAAKREDAITHVIDKAECLITLSENQNSIEGLIAFIEKLFVEDEDSRMITLSSVHKAKGLERDRAFVLADTFKSTSIEEDNLWYVACTRAKTDLFLVYGIGKTKEKEENEEEDPELDIRGEPGVLSKTPGFPQKDSFSP